MLDSWWSSCLKLILKLQKKDKFGRLVIPNRDLARILEGTDIFGMSVQQIACERTIVYSPLRLVHPSIHLHYISTVDSDSSPYTPFAILQDSIMSFTQDHLNDSFACDTQSSYGSLELTSETTTPAVSTLSSTPTKRKRSDLPNFFSIDQNNVKTCLNTITPGKRCRGTKGGIFSKATGDSTLWLHVDKCFGTSQNQSIIGLTQKRDFVLGSVFNQKRSEEACMKWIVKDQVL